MSSNVDLNNRPEYDDVLQAIADYAVSYTHLTLPTTPYV